MKSSTSNSSFGGGSAASYERIPTTPPISVTASLPRVRYKGHIPYGSRGPISDHLSNSVDDVTLPPQEQIGILDQYLNDSLSNESRQVSSLSLARSVSFTGGGSGPRPYLGRRLSRSLPELRDIKNHLSPLFEKDELDDDEDIEGNAEKDALPGIWNKKLDFILCSACQALGLGNMWRFPYFCYINGGGSFLIAYLILMLLCGIPILCLEYTLGQMTQRASVAAFGKLGSIVKGVGVAGILTSFWIMSYYSTINAWALFYFFNSFFSLPPWSHCSNAWNTEECRESTSKKAAALNLWPTPETTESPLADQQNSSSITALSYNNLLSTTGFLETMENQTLLTSPDTPTTQIPIHTTSIASNMSEGNISIAVQEFFDNKLLEVHGQLDSPGEIRWELLASVLFSWFIAYFLLRKTAAFTGRTTYCLAVISYLLLLALLLRAIMLEKSDVGLKFFFNPRLNGFRNSKVWLYALAQTFHSTSAVLGTSVAMSSSNKRTNNVIRDAITTAFITILTAIIIGSVVFATLGHLSFQWNTRIDSVVFRDPGMVFVVFSELLASMPLSPFWCVIVFLVIFCLGMDSQVSLLETVVGTIEDAYGHFVKTHFHSHQLFLLVTCTASLLTGILYVTQGGICFIQVTDYYAGVILIIMVALLEVGAVGCIYGGSKLSTQVQEMISSQGSFCYFSWCWSFISPVLIVAILGYSISEMDNLQFRDTYTYPAWGEGLGWLLVCITLIPIPILAVHAIRKTPKTNIFVRISAAAKSHLDDCQENSNRPNMTFLPSDPVSFDAVDAKLKKEALPSIPELDVLNITQLERETCI